MNKKPTNKVFARSDFGASTYATLYETRKILPKHTIHKYSAYGYQPTMYLQIQISDMPRDKQEQRAIL